MSDFQPINCVDCQSHLVEFALDELPEQLRAPIAEHLANGCAACNEQLSEVLSGLAKLVYALPAERPAASVESELFKRIATQNRESRSTWAAESAVIPVAVKTPTRRLAVAAALLAASIVGIVMWSNSGADKKSRFAANDEWAEVQRRVAHANATAHFSAMPELKFASSRKPSADSIVEGYVVVDQLAKQWHVYAFHLPAISTERKYLLWFDLGEGRFVRAGTAEIDDEGALASVIDVPSEIIDPKGLAISDEAEAAPERPTGENFVEAPLR